MALRIADQSVKLADAVRWLGEYSTDQHGTLADYDGHSPGPRRGWRKFTSDDITAARVIERRALHDDVAERILGADLPWNATPSRSIDIADVSPGSRAYDQLARFYLDLKALHGVGPAIASKMMYLRWPFATPILDSLLEALYRDTARAKYEDLKAADALPTIAREAGWTRLYTFAVRDDVIHNRERGQFASLRQKVQRELDPSLAQQLVDLSDCRLLDILAWKLQKGG